MKKEIKHLVGVKVKSIDHNSLYFEDGTVIEFHPFETYVSKPKKPIIQKNK